MEVQTVRMYVQEKKDYYGKCRREDRVVFCHHVDSKSMLEWEFVHYTHIKKDRTIKISLKKI